MNIKIKILLILIILGYLLYNFLTLAISPIPWFDEVWFASITHSFITKGKFLLEICPLRTDKEVLAYGPVYFLLTAASVKLLGFGIFSFRLVNFLFGLANIYVFYNIIKYFIKDRLWVLLTTLLIIFDNIYCSNIHGGRMDSVAIFFCLVSLNALLIDKLKPRNLLLSGVFAVLAILTTPRSGFLFLSIIVFIISIDGFKVHIIEKIRNLIIWVLPIIIVYALWIWYAFGNIGQFLEYYIHPGKVANIPLTTSVGGKLFIPQYQVLLIITTIILLISGIFKKKIKPDIFIIISIINIVGFYFLVNDSGAYSVYIIYFLYGLFCYLLYKFEFKQNLQKFKFAIYALVLFVNLCIFSIKTITVFACWEARDFHKIDQIVKANISQGAKVVGCDRYYYSVIKNNDYFQTVERPKSNLERAEYHRNQFNFEYLIISDEIEKSKPDILKQYNNGSLILVSHFMLKGTGIINKINKITGMKISESYNGEIYKRKLNNNTIIKQL